MFKDLQRCCNPLAKDLAFCEDPFDQSLWGTSKRCFSCQGRDPKYWAPPRASKPCCCQLCYCNAERRSLTGYPTWPCHCPVLAVPGKPNLRFSRIRASNGSSQPGEAWQILKLPHFSHLQDERNSWTTALFFLFAGCCSLSWRKAAWWPQNAAYLESYRGSVHERQGRKVKKVASRTK